VGNGLEMRMTGVDEFMLFTLAVGLVIWVIYRWITGPLE